MKIDPQTTPDPKTVAFVIEKKRDPNKMVTIIDKWVPAKDGEPSQVLFGTWGNFQPMRLESQKVIDD